MTIGINISIGLFGPSRGSRLILAQTSSYDMS